MLSNNFQPKKGVTTWTMLVTGRLIRFEVWTNRKRRNPTKLPGFLSPGLRDFGQKFLIIIL